MAPTDAPTGRAGFDAERTLRAMHEHAVTGASLVPTQLRRLLDAAAATEGPDTLPDSLRFVLLGGGPAPDALVERCGRRDVPVRPTYGLTETASQVTTAPRWSPSVTPSAASRPAVRSTARSRAAYVSRSPLRASTTAVVSGE